MERTLTITGLEANVLLFALDAYLGVDDRGMLLGDEPGYTAQALQSLRDRLLGVHEHPAGLEDEYEERP